MSTEMLYTLYIIYRTVGFCYYWNRTLRSHPPELGWAVVKDDFGRPITTLTYYVTMNPILISFGAQYIYRLVPIKIVLLMT